MVREVVRADLDPISCHSLAAAREQLELLDGEQVPLLGIIVDVMLPDGSGMDFLEHLRGRYPLIPAIVMSGQLEPEVINRAHLLDAHFALKPDTLANLRRFLSQISSPPPPTLLAEVPRFAAEHRLTKREADLLALLACGVTRRNLAHRLAISEESVKTHVKHILRSTGDDNVSELVARLMRVAAAERAGR